MQSAIDGLGQQGLDLSALHSGLDLVCHFSPGSFS
jgi:hypothetical protein